MGVKETQLEVQRFLSSIQLSNQTTGTLQNVVTEAFTMRLYGNLSSPAKSQAFRAIQDTKDGKETVRQIEFLNDLVDCHQPAGSVIEFARYQLRRSANGEYVVLHMMAMWSELFASRPQLFKSIPSFCRAILVAFDPSSSNRANVRSIARLSLATSEPDYCLIALYAYFGGIKFETYNVDSIQERHFTKYAQKLVTQIYGGMDTTVASRRGTWIVAFDFIQKLAGKLSRNFIAIPFGSVASGFYSKDSDLDVCIHPRGTPGPNLDKSRNAQLTWCEKFRQLLKTQSDARLCIINRVVIKARVPIVRLGLTVKGDPNPLEVDVSFFNMHGPRNTYLLRVAAERSPGIVPAGVVVKAWASSWRVVQQKYLPPTAWILLYLRFVQHRYPDLKLSSRDIPTSVDAMGEALIKALHRPPSIRSIEFLNLYMAVSSFFIFAGCEFGLPVKIVDLEYPDRTFESLVTNKIHGGRPPIDCDWDSLGEEERHAYCNRPICVADRANGDRLFTTGDSKVTNLTFRKLLTAMLHVRDMKRIATKSPITHIDLFNLSDEKITEIDRLFQN